MIIMLTVGGARWRHQSLNHIASVPHVSARRDVATLARPRNAYPPILQILHGFHVGFDLARDRLRHFSRRQGSIWRVLDATASRFSLCFEVRCGRVDVSCTV
jgi:hypothetical protein